MRSILSHPSFYQLWQAPFYREKMEPIVRTGAIKTARNVLEIGCGPGTNASFFSHCNYCGIDISEDYVEYARTRHKGTFQIGDATRLNPKQFPNIDFILMNSLLHHINDDGVLRILGNINSMLASGGHLHIIELSLPDRPSVSRWLAKNDRGEYVRPLEEWNEIFNRNLGVECFEPFTVRRFGVELWKFVYCRARAKS